MQEDWADRASTPGGIPADEAAWWNADAGSADEADIEDDAGAPPASGAKRRVSKRALDAARCAAGWL